jgi:deoxyribonuclease-4
MKPLLGAHVSVAGGLALAFERGREIGCDALQIFVKNASQWRARPLAAHEIAAFRDAHDGAGRPPLVAHAAYLINLAARDPVVLERSREALADEARRCAALGVPALVVHPGAHLGAGEAAGLAAVTTSLDAVDAELDDCPTRILLELTAGQGSVLGSRLEQLAEIIAGAHAAPRLEVCLDTCHAFAAGYEVGTAAGVEDFLAAVAATVGWERVTCVHLNDSVGERGSRRDRHANVGKGRIGLAGFRRLLGEPRLARVPMILETPIGEDGLGHARDLARLRALVAATSAGRSGRPASRRRTRAR